MNGGINILFYSRNCQYCQNLLKILQNENLLASFRLYCVDGKLENLPEHIKRVPTMIVSNCNKPLVAEETFEWVQKIKFIKNKQFADMKNKLTENMMKVLENNGPAGFASQEMTGISDSFAYTNVDVPVSHTYFGVNDEQKNVIFTAPEQGKIGKDEQTKRIKDMENRRKEQDQTYTTQMKQEQLEAVYSKEQNSGKRQ